MAYPFRIGPWTVEPSLHRIVGSDGEPRLVSHKVMTLLVCLAQRGGDVVSKNELIEQVWDGAFTSDESLTTVIYELRKALDDSARQPKFIETIRKGGYRLLAKVEEIEPSPPADVPPPEAPPSEILPPVLASTADRAESQVRRWPWAVALALALALALVAGAVTWSFSRQASASRETGAAEMARQAPSPTAVADEIVPRLESLAVLPLNSFGETCGEDAFAGALTEMLVVDLAEEIPLEVLPSIATRSLSGQWDLEQVVDQLDADLVIEGSVIRSGGRLWLSVQLVDTASGRMLWGGSFERQVEDPLLVQRELARSIANEVQRIIVDAASTAASGDALVGAVPLLTGTESSAADGS